MGLPRHYPSTTSTTSTTPRADFPRAGCVVLLKSPCVSPFVISKQSAFLLKLVKDNNNTFIGQTGLWLGRVCVTHTRTAHSCLFGGSACLSAVTAVGKTHGYDSHLASAGGTHDDILPWGAGVFVACEITSFHSINQPLNNNTLWRGTT